MEAQVNTYQHQEPTQHPTKLNQLALEERRRNANDTAGSKYKMGETKCLSLFEMFVLTLFTKLVVLLGDSTTIFL